MSANSAQMQSTKAQVKDTKIAAELTNGRPLLVDIEEFQGHSLWIFCHDLGFSGMYHSAKSPNRIHAYIPCWPLEALREQYAQYSLFRGENKPQVDRPDKLREIWRLRHIFGGFQWPKRMAIHITRPVTVIGTAVTKNSQISCDTAQRATSVPLPGVNSKKFMPKNPSEC